MIRTTITPDTPNISLEIPADYVGREIEIIAFAKNEAVQTGTFTSKKVSFDAVAIDTRGYQFNREEANER